METVRLWHSHIPRTLPLQNLWLAIAPKKSFWHTPDQRFFQNPSCGELGNISLFQRQRRAFRAFRKDLFLIVESRDVGGVNDRPSLILLETALHVLGDVVSESLKILFPKGFRQIESRTARKFSLEMVRTR